MSDEDNRLSDQECGAVLEALFPHGFAGADVLAEIAGEGWMESGLGAVAHPSAERVWEEVTTMYRNMRELFGKRKEPEGQEELREPMLEEIREKHVDGEVRVEEECESLVGRCVWDVFSDNHEVIAPDGREADLGSFRGTGDFLAEWLAGHGGRAAYDYMDFYMGTTMVSGRADVSGIYRMIFGRLKRLGYTWRYSFPRLGVVRFGGMPKEEGAGYDPETALAREQEEAKKQREFEEMREGLRKDYNEAVRGSRHGPAPEIVKAYMAVYGRAPEGWPPEEDEGGAEG